MTVSEFLTGEIGTPGYDRGAALDAALAYLKEKSSVPEEKSSVPEQHRRRERERANNRSEKTRQAKRNGSRRKQAVRGLGRFLELLRELS